MLNYVHNIPTRIYFGQGQIQQLPHVLAPLGQRVLLVYGGGSIKRTGLYDTIMALLQAGGFTVTELAGVEPNPRIQSVERGVQLCRENGVDVILAVGGGSAIDCAKAIACGVYYTGDDLWQMIVTSGGFEKALPLVDVLTLSATGSEFDGFGVISNRKLNEKLGAVLTYPTASICDPTYTFTVSPYQTAAGSADIMSHIFEGYFSREEDCALSDGVAETVLKTVMKYTPIALQDPENYSARANLMTCSSVACSGIPEYGKEYTGWPCHAMEHELSAFYDITHGVGLAILTPRWMRFILEKDPAGALPRFVRFAENVMGLTGNDRPALARAAIDRLEAYFRSTGIPMTLRALNIGQEHFEDMADHAVAMGGLENAFVPLTRDDIVAIFQSCL